MDDSKGTILPGTTVTHIAQGEKGFAKIAILLEATGGLSLSQVCSVTGLEGSTIQNWVKRGWVAHPKGKKYEEKHIARILIINALKECIKLEHIAQLMTYINGYNNSQTSDMIKESDLYNYLCEALPQLGKVDDLSRGGVESVVETVIRDFKESAPGARVRIRKALSLMIYACVCTDVKRRTEAMMDQILRELENPESVAEEILVDRSSEDENPVTGEVPDDLEHAEKGNAESGAEIKKTIAQALREWDLTRVEDIINEDDRIEDAEGNSDSSVKPDAEKKQPAENPEKPAQKPWYFRRN